MVNKESFQLESRSNVKMTKELKTADVSWNYTKRSES